MPRSLSFVTSNRIAQKWPNSMPSYLVSLFILPILCEITVSPRIIIIMYCIWLFNCVFSNDLIKGASSSDRINTTNSSYKYAVLKRRVFRWDRKVEREVGVGIGLKSA